VLAKRAVRYVLTGALTTLVAYVATMLFLRLMNYIPATALAWVVTVGFGFTINRRFTFGIVGPERRGRDFGLFVVGAAMQLAITLVSYSITLGRLGLDPSLAFAINLVVTTSFGFAFLNLVAFRRARQANPG
jgi:putative flippase GtrA